MEIINEDKRKVPLCCGIRYLSYIRELEDKLDEEELIVEVIFNPEEKIYYALTAVGPDAPERFPSGGSLSQIIGQLRGIVGCCGLRLANVRENYGIQVDEYSAELLLGKYIKINLGGK